MIIVLKQMFRIYTKQMLRLIPVISLGTRTKRTKRLFAVFCCIIAVCCIPFIIVVNPNKT